MARHRSDESTEIESADDFRDALGELLLAAYRNDVEVHGGWPMHPASDGSTAWDVEITPLSRETTHQAPETDEFPIEAILTAVATREDVQEDELPPLQRSVDVDSISQVYADMGAEMPGEVTFEYCGYTVSVFADGQITVDG